VRRVLARGDAAPDVSVVVTGMGQEAATAAASSWAPRVAAVVVCGIAGGLGGAAGAGDVVVASRLLDAAGADVGPVVALEVPGTVQGAVASVAAPVDDAAGRAALRAVGAVAVETEAAAWARACAVAGAPLVVVRAILDTPSLPLGRAAGLVQPGAAAPRAVDVVRVAVRPSAWTTLLRVGRMAGPAERSAARAAVSCSGALVDRSRAAL
jgi:nucleoside phosphorylase